MDEKILERAEKALCLMAESRGYSQPDVLCGQISGKDAAIMNSCGLKAGHLRRLVQLAKRSPIKGMIETQVMPKRKFDFEE